MLSRWISALCGIALLFSIIYFFGPTGLVVFSSILVFIAAVEFSLLFEIKFIGRFLFLLFNTFVFLSHLLVPHWTLAILVFSFVNLTSFGILFYRDDTPQNILAKIQWTLWGIIYTGLFPALGIHTVIEKGPHPLIFLLVTVFAGDTLALFTGKYFGSTKIFPNLSPKKTIAGGFGGLIGSVIAGSVYLHYFSPNSHLVLDLALCLSLGFFAQFGDFFESLVKRVSGKKDAGRIMPGHGGLLDRVDGVYFASAVLYFFFTIISLKDFF